MDNRQKGGNGSLYDTLALILEILVFWIKSLIHFVYNVFRIFFPPEEESVAGELVLITGTGHGIGKELAKQYGELGAEIICVDINKESNQATVDELRKLGIKAHMYICDVSMRENVLELGKKIQKEVGDVTILVNNAGIMPCKAFLDHKPEEIKKMFDINVFAHFWMLEAFLPNMIKKDKGHVVGVSSVAGLFGNKNIVPYNASKFAVRGLMEGLYYEFRKSNTNVRFTVVYPFITDTGLCKKPRIRFPSLTKILTPAETATYIISAQRKNYVEAGVPPYVFYLNGYGRLITRSCANLLYDFLGTGLEPHE